MISVINPSQYGGSFTSRPTSVVAPDFGGAAYSGSGSGFSANFSCANFGGDGRHSKMSASGSSNGSSGIPACFMPNSSELYYMSVAASTAANSGSTTNGSSSKVNCCGVASSNSQSGNNSSQVLFQKPWANHAFHPEYRTSSATTVAASSASSSNSSRSMIVSLSNTVAAPNPWMLPASRYANSCQNSCCSQCQIQTVAAAASQGNKSVASSFAEQYTQACRVQELEHRKRLSSRSIPAVGQAAKDYSKPLFVDCSIEYELPNAPKIPKNSEPILMIHPAYNNNNNLSKPSVKPQPTRESSRQIIPPKTNSSDFKKLEYECYKSRNENCSLTVNATAYATVAKSEMELHQVRKEREQQLSLYRQQQQQQHEHFLNQHLRQQALQAQHQQLSMEVKHARRMSVPKKQDTKMVNSMRPVNLGTCSLYHCQCPEAVNYRRRLLQHNQMNQHQSYVNNNNIVKPAMGRGPMASRANLKRSYADAMLMNPNYIYNSKSGALSHPLQLTQNQQHQLYPTMSKQGRFSLY